MLVKKISNLTKRRKVQNIVFLIILNLKLSKYFSLPDVKHTHKHRNTVTGRLLSTLLQRDKSKDGKFALVLN